MVLQSGPACRGVAPHGTRSIQELAAITYAEVRRRSNMINMHIFSLKSRIQQRTKALLNPQTPARSVCYRHTRFTHLNVPTVSATTW
jgi:hypothetical protein